MLRILHRRAAGLDIGAREIWACGSSARDAEPVRRFGTFTPDLMALVDWLVRCGVDTVAMEAIPSRCARGTNGRGISDPSVRTARRPRAESLPGQRPASEAGAGAHIVPTQHPVRAGALRGQPVGANGLRSGQVCPCGKSDYLG